MECGIDEVQKNKVLPTFVWVKIRWSKSFVFNWMRVAAEFSVSNALGGRDQQVPQVPPPKPPTPFPSVPPDHTSVRVEVR